MTEADGTGALTVREFLDDSEYELEDSDLDVCCDHIFQS